MRNYVTFLKKEWLESLRTYKLFVMLASFSILGIMNPLIAKLTPEIIDLAMPEGMEIAVAVPTAFDSWAQFYKNTGQIGVIVTVIVFSGIISGELSRGTLIHMLTKGLSRSSVILSKYTYMVMRWSAGLGLSCLITWVYTVYLFPDGRISHLFFSVFCLWLFGVFLLALLLFAGSLVRATGGGLLLTGAGVGACMALQMIPVLQKRTPFALVTENMGLIQNTVKPPELSCAAGITGVLALVLAAGAVLVFRKKQL